MKPGFLSEPAAYALLARAGGAVPRHGWLDAAPPFAAGEPIVLKGLGEDLWHKSELGAVQFAPFDAAALAPVAAAMRTRVETAGHRWLGALVCERIAIARVEGLPAEGFVSLSRHEAGWIALVGCGGMGAISANSGKSWALKCGETALRACPGTNTETARGEAD